MDKIKLIQKQIDRIDPLKILPRNSAPFKGWHRHTRAVLIRLFGEDSYQIEDFNRINYSLAASNPYTPQSRFDEAFTDGLDEAKMVLLSFIEEINDFSEVDDKSDQLSDQNIVQGLSTTYDGKIVKDDKYQNKDNFTVLSDEIMYEVKFNESTREITINNFLLSRPNWDSDNYNFFKYVFENPNVRLEAKDIDKRLKPKDKRVKGKNKNYHQIISDLKFTGDLKTAFFNNVSSTSIVFANPVSKEHLEKLGIKKLSLK